MHFKVIRNFKIHLKMYIKEIGITEHKLFLYSTYFVMLK